MALLTCLGIAHRTSGLVIGNDWRSTTGESLVARSSIDGARLACPGFICSTGLTRARTHSPCPVLTDNNNSLKIAHGAKSDIWAILTNPVQSLEQEKPDRKVT